MLSINGINPKKLIFLALVECPKSQFLLFTWIRHGEQGEVCIALGLVCLLRGCNAATAATHKEQDEIDCELSLVHTAFKYTSFKKYRDISLTKTAYN